MKQILGITDDRDFCQCCGKEGLARVVWVKDLESGEVRHFGTTCATKHTGLLFPQIRQAAKAYVSEQKRAAEAEFEASPEQQDYLAELAKCNAGTAPLFGKLRFEYLTPFIEAAREAEKKIFAKYGL